MPFQHLHDDIERRTSSRALGAVLSFWLPLTSRKRKAAETPMFGIPAAKVRTIAKAIYSA